MQNIILGSILIIGIFGCLCKKNKKLKEELPIYNDENELVIKNTFYYTDQKKNKKSFGL